MAKLTFSSGIEVTVRPPGRRKAAWLVVRFAPLAALPQSTPNLVAIVLLYRVARQVLPYVRFDVPAGADRAVYLAETVLRTIDDWGQLTRALLVNMPGQAKR